MISHTQHTIPAGVVDLFTITNASGASVTLSSLGAGVVAVSVPDSSGRLADVALGYTDVASYMADGPCAGKVPGRYGNRIARGHFSIDGHEFSLPINNGPNHLHGGPDGFQNHLWKVQAVGSDSVTFSHVSPDGDSGYPGTLTATATYRWTDDCTLSLTLTAATTAPTVVNLTNHTYWNLDGHNAGSVLDHTLQLNASRFLPTDDSLVPTGELLPVVGTPMDFSAPKPLGRDIKADFPALRYGKGYDNCWAVDDYHPGTIKEIATLVAPVSGRRLTIATDQPGVQVYTGNWLDGSPLGKDGYDYHDYDAVAIECQDFPDAPNIPAFPSTRLNPGEEYCRHIIFHFSTDN